MFLEERSYIRAIMHIIPFKSRFEELMELIGEVIRRSLLPGWGDAYMQLAWLHVRLTGTYPST